MERDGCIGLKGEVGGSGGSALHYRKFYNPVYCHKCQNILWMLDVGNQQMAGCVGLQLQKVLVPKQLLSSRLLSLEEAAWKKLIISEDAFGGDPAQVRIIPPY